MKVESFVPPHAVAHKGLQVVERSQRDPEQTVVESGASYRFLHFLSLARMKHLPHPLQLMLVHFEVESSQAVRDKQVTEFGMRETSARLEQERLAEAYAKKIRDEQPADLRAPQYGYSVP